MQSLLFAATIAFGLASQASALPPTRRANSYSDCTAYATGTLKVKYNPYATGRNAGVVSGVTHSGVDYQQASILVTENGSGKNIAPQQWEFARCSSITSYNGVDAGSDGETNTVFGLLRPAGASVHCLASESSAQNANKVSVVDSVCKNIPEQYRTWTLSEDLTGTGPNKYSLTFGDYHSIIGNTKHAELSFVETLPQRGGEVTINLQ